MSHASYQIYFHSWQYHPIPCAWLHDHRCVPHDRKKKLNSFTFTRGRIIQPIYLFWMSVSQSLHNLCLKAYHSLEPFQEKIHFSSYNQYFIITEDGGQRSLVVMNHIADFSCLNSRNSLCLADWFFTDLLFVMFVMPFAVESLCFTGGKLSAGFSTSGRSASTESCTVLFLSTFLTNRHMLHDLTCDVWSLCWILSLNLCW